MINVGIAYLEQRQIRRQLVFISSVNFRGWSTETTDLCPHIMLLKKGEFKSAGCENQAQSISSEFLLWIDF